MIFRQADYRDLDPIMEIIGQAQSDFKSRGIDQWQNNYPNRETIEGDIGEAKSYVLVKDGRIVATVYLSFDGEKTYDQIYQGQWLSQENYLVIHRLAVALDQRGQGLAKAMMDRIEDFARSKGVYCVRLDTHRDNLAMQGLLDKSGYLYCGVILLEDGSDRLAYEKKLGR